MNLDSTDKTDDGLLSYNYMTYSSSLSFDAFSTDS
jgi:hypothetical protein